MNNGLDLKRKISKTIVDAIDFLAKNQEKDGSFFSYTAGDFKGIEGVKRHHSVFPAILILSCLNELNLNNDAEKIRSNLFEFLLSQKSEHWSFNYWVRGSREVKKMPYPDDVDDTFCALSAIYKYRPDIINGVALAKIITLLTVVEKEEGGPYRTWLVPENSKEVWKDIDLAVNSNIAYFLSLQEVSLPKIKKIVENAIDANAYISPYYPSEYPIIYFISRWYRGNKKQKAIDFLFSKQDKNGVWGNSLNTALAISALLNFGVRVKKVERAVQNLIESQQKNGAWKPFAFCIEIIVEGKKYYAGSPSLTTAFCVEAINKYNKNFKSQISNNKQILNSKLLKREEKIYNNIIKKYKQRFADFPNDFKDEAVKIRDRVLRKSKDVALLPFYFKNALGETGEKISDDFVVQLGLANLYGWAAYTIYDDFFDNDNNNSEILSLANICLRESVNIFSAVLPENSEYQKLCSKIFNEIDSANYFEAKYCRLEMKNKDFVLSENFLRLSASALRHSSLWQKSMGHSIGPLAIMFSLGYSEGSPEIKNLITFFKNYITARQLNDDAHDWEQDLEMGILTPAVSLVIKEWRKSKPEFVVMGFIDIKKHLPKFQQIFWRKTIVSICREILKRVKIAEADLNKIKIIKDKTFLKNMLSTPRDSAKKALSERNEALKFLREFKI